MQWYDVAALDLSTHVLLDEREQGCLPNSQHIPLNLLRERLDELPKGKTIVLYCQSGQRSYFGTRLLTHHGFKAKNLSGAYLTWSVMNPLSASHCLDVLSI